MHNYKRTYIACHIGYIVQAVVINFAPLLFIIFHQTYNISLEKISGLIAINFGVQLLTDFLSANFVDKLGYKFSAILANVLACAGLICLASLPLIIDPFSGIAVSTVIYAIGGGLLEVLLSPIIEALPSENKEKSMVKLFAFYSWGQVFTIFFTTLFFLLFGVSKWRIAALLWAILPLINIIVFSKAPIAKLLSKEQEQLSLKELFKNRSFWIFLILMLCTGAAVEGVSQWASTLAEIGLGLDKITGDLLGPMFYAVMVGSTRLMYIRFGHKFNLDKLMLSGGILSIAAYMIISLSPYSALAVIGCGLAGIAMGTMWPGTIRRASATVKGGGTKMFAFLALFGDIGCALGPAIIGLFAASFGIRKGILIGVIFPIVLVIFLFINYRKHNMNNQ